MERAAAGSYSASVWEHATANTQLAAQRLEHIELVPGAFDADRRSPGRELWIFEYRVSRLTVLRYQQMQHRRVVAGENSPDADAAVGKRAPSASL